MNLIELIRQPIQIELWFVVSCVILMLVMSTTLLRSGTIQHSSLDSGLFTQHHITRVRYRLYSEHDKAYHEFMDWRARYSIPRRGDLVHKKIDHPGYRVVDVDWSEEGLCATVYLKAEEEQFKQHFY